MKEIIAAAIIAATLAICSPAQAYNGPATLLTLTATAVGSGTYKEEMFAVWSDCSEKRKSIEEERNGDVRTFCVPRETGDPVAVVWTADEG